MENSKLSRNIQNAKNNLEYEIDQLIAYIEELEEDVNKKTARIDELEDEVKSYRTS